MDINEIAILGSSIGTFFGAIIILVTLFEMKKQRKSSYRPDIILSHTNFYVYQNKSTDQHLPLCFFYIWSTEKLEETDLKNIDVYNDKLGVKLKVYNIGLGAAKAISFYWDFDIIDLAKKIKEHDADKKFSIYWGFDSNDLAKKIKEKKFSISGYKERTGRLMIEYKGIQNYFNLEEQETREYLLPSSIENQPNILRIPETYTALVSILLSLYCQAKIYESIVTLPKLKLTTNYKDVGNNSHKKVFLIEPEISMVQSIENKDIEIIESVRGNIKPKEI